MPKSVYKLLRSLWGPVASDTSGVAGIEFCVVSGVLMIGLLNGIEFARWYYQKMEMTNAVHSASYAVWKACDSKMLPAKTNCPGLTNAITNAVQSTSLGTSVTLTSGYPTEAYYCVNSTGVLTQVSTISSKPADCTAVGDTTHAPGDYVVVAASYTYSPLFSTITIGGHLPTAMTSTAYMRLM